MAYVRKMLDLSTAHLPPSVGLDGLGDAPGVIAYGTLHGWLMWVPDDPDDSARVCGRVDEQILSIQRYARGLGCDYVMFDADGDPNDDLPAWDN